jgi:inorganic pyrophosphatase
MIKTKEIVIEQPKGSYKSFEIQGDPLWKDYPLEGMTYPVNYGYVKGYKSEDNHDLDIFVGSGKIKGYIKVWRCDIPRETKIIWNVTEKEWEAIIRAFKPVIKERKQYIQEEAFDTFLANYKR